MMKNKSIIAKLLAEEDIFVVYKKMETAYFNPKTRELGLPIWNDELMTADIEDLMVCHEIAHALWTPLDMLEQAQSRKINHSFVNIIEDARIERMVQERYRGSVAVFNRGYRDLTEQDFFSLNDRDVSELNLIDRINLFFKKQKVEFSDEEKVWVKKVSECKTSDDVLNLAEELYKFMQDQEEEQQSNGSSSEDTSESDESDESDDMNSDTSSSESSEEGEENLAPSNSGSADDEEKDSTDDSIQSDSNDVTNKQEPEATTDTDTNNAIEKLIDEKASDRVYANIPSIPSEDVIIEYDKILNECRKTYSDELSSEYYTSTKKTIVDMKADSKKTVAYMVKEFEMKKSADQYARAAVSKTGSLDMNRLHTYKYNEDLFKKVTTLPGATNHGMVMVVDWSGSMYNNLKGTLQQLFNLIWFCRRTQIPFEVYAFTNSNTALSFPDNSQYADYSSNLLPFKSGDLRLNNMRLLNFFSSKMKVDEEIEMMHALYMVAQVFAPSYSRDLGYIHRIDQPRILDLSSTPLNEAIIAMMDIVPKFKKDTGVQKVNTIFLTDGESNMTRYVYDLKFNADKNEHEQSTIRLGSYNSSGGRNEIIFTDKKTRKTYVLEDKRGSDMTNQLLKILKDRVDGMNLVGFFIAGNGKSGRVDKRIIADLLDKSIWDVVDEVKFVNKNKYLAITSAGYDEYYILPGGNNLQVENGGLSDDLTGASKAKLKSAFGKSMKGKISSRQLLDKFVKLVA
tara:strand:- start:205 stop:2415 length:2211 start_codon:yes stop_codon:yes gene_type:complete